MGSELFALGYDAKDPAGLARFWAGVLQRELLDNADDGIVLLPGDDIAFPIRFTQSDEPKTGPNQMHFDLTSQSPEEQQETVARVLELGGRHLDIGQGPDAKHVVLADPEDNEFCVIEAGNNFLADTGFIGALAGDGTQAVGYFWAKALDWPLVWDQDEETAIQSPRGGTKITWGGPPVNPKTGKIRLYFDLTPAAGVDAQTEADRLTTLGATRLDTNDPHRIPMTDPDGNEFYLLSPR
ncbi:VOC family protein [Kribbella sp. NPDC023855]|uniref:VOC family protein n=1 Tax=Kribbella sp. NPDC023855 TaxID=3154698 RepID=UPI0033DF8073